MESNFVQAGKVRLQYYQHGNGPEDVLLVHGYASSARLWHLTMEQMDTARFRVIAVNHRGAGDSDRASSEGPFGEDAYTVETFADDQFNVVQALGLNGFTLVGHSMGGATVAQFSLAHQGLLKALVLLNSAPLDGRPLDDGWDTAIREKYASGDLTPDNLGIEAPHITQEFIQAVTGDIARNPIERALGGRPSMSKMRLRDRLKELKIPTMVVGGDQDTTVGIDNILADFQALPEGIRSLHIFHGIGHSPNVEVPQRLAGLLTRFVEEASAVTSEASALGR